MKRKVCIVTGASSELGKETISLLVHEEYFIYTVTREKANFSNPNIKNAVFDITNKESSEKFIKQMMNSEDGVYALINIAGVTKSGETLSFDGKDFRDLLEINVVSAFELIKGIYPLMKKDGGRIINITSLNGLIALPNFGIYSATKFALEGLGNALFYELKHDNIFVTNIAPGAIEKKDYKAVLTHKPAREKFPILKFVMPMLTARDVAKSIVKIITEKSPPSSVVLGMDAKIMLFSKRFLPRIYWEKLMLYIWQRK